MGIFDEYGTDKDIYHGYGVVYDEILAPLKESALCVLEIGVATGESLRAWHNYFPKAEIVGIDKDLSQINYSRLGLPPSLYDESSRYSLWQGDAGIIDVLTEVTLIYQEIDVIIDDGSHILKDQLFCLLELWQHLADGGIYVIEDLMTPYWRHDLRWFFSQFPNARVYRTGKRPDDLIAVIRKSPVV